MSRRHRAPPMPPKLAAGTLAVAALFGCCGVLKVNACLDDIHREGEARRATEALDRDARHAAAVESDRETQRRRDAENERKKQFEREESARSPEARATLALSTLASAPATKGVVADAAICRAHELLDAIEPKARGAKGVGKAFAQMRAKEGPALAKLRAEAAADSSRSLVCIDGSFSPSCSCNGPHRGCCSHHGGIAGCEPLPSKVACLDSELAPYHMPESGAPIVAAR